ncbi:hypothetical protein [Rhodococcus koreensis]
MLLLSALGLLASGVAVTTALEKSLTSRIDHQLHTAALGWADPRSEPQPRPAQLGSGRPPTRVGRRAQAVGFGDR